jgi:hypothetical protein
MNNTGCMAFSTELYCLRQIIPQQSPVVSGMFLPSLIAYGKITSQRSPVIFGLFLSCCIAYGKIIPQHFIANIFLGHNIEMYGVNGNNMESR